MKTANIKITQLTNEEMLNHSSKEYNQSIWKQSVNRMIKFNANFYEAKPDELYSYSRFFTQYKTIEGLYFLSDYNPFSSSITSNGFRKAFIINGEIFTMGFGKERTEAVINNKEGRKWLKENICLQGIMITCSI
jgi:hypothetical protein